VGPRIREGGADAPGQANATGGAESPSGSAWRAKRATFVLDLVPLPLSTRSIRGEENAVADDNIIGIDGRQAAQLREDQAQREKREETVRAKSKCLGFELRPGMAPGSYTIAHPHAPQPPYLNGWRDISLDQVEDATSDI
jgi:hypothetical protein